MKLYKLSDNKLFFKFLLYFSVMFLTLLLLLGSLNYVYSIKVIDVKNERFYESLLINAKQSIENRLKYLNELSVFLLNDKRFMRMLNDKEWENNRIDAFEIINELKVIQFTNPYMEDISLYIAKKQSLLRIYGIEEPLEYLHQTYGREFQVFDDILINASKWSNFYYLEPSDLLINNQTKNAMTFIKTKGNNESAVNAGIVFMINSRWLNEILPASKSDNSVYAFIKDSSNNIITNDHNNFYEKLDTSKYTMFSEKINGIPWEIVIAVKKNSTLFVKEYTQTYILAISCLMFVGLILSLLLSFGNYKPVKKIMNLIDSDLLGEEEKVPARDEYTRIKQYIGEKDETTKVLQDKVTAYTQLTMENMLYRLITDTSLKDEEVKVLSTEVFMTGTKSASSFLAAQLRVSKPSSRNGVSSRLEEVSLQALYDSINSYAMNHSIIFKEMKGNSRQHILLFGFVHEHSSVSLLLFIQSCKALLESENDISIYMGAGSLVFNMEDIHNSYKQASYSLSYAMIQGNREIAVYDYGDIPKHDGIFYSMETEMKLINAFTSMDRICVEEIVKSVVHENLFEKSISLPSCKCLYYELGATFIKGLKTIDPDYKGLNLDEIVQNYSVQDLPLLALQLLEEVAESAAARKDTNSIHNQVILLVEDYYSKPKLTLQFIAEQLKITTYALTKNIDFDLQDYINRKRVNRSMELLTDSELSIKEISELSGFSDVNVFIRIFKRHEMTTPGQYRKKYIRKI